MDLGVISVRYARALLKAATEQKQEQRVYEEMQTLANSFIQIPELRLTIDNPMLPKNKKQELLETACGKELSKLLRDFFTLVLREGREGMLQFMAASYIRLYRKQKNLISGKLTTATPVSSIMEKRMETMVQARTKGSVEFNTEIDPDIIGGFILEYDTYRLDASVKAKLNSILTQLKK